jgi:hypothetical protein
LIKDKKDDWLGIVAKILFTHKFVGKKIVVKSLLPKLMNAIGTQPIIKKEPQKMALFSKKL